MYAFKTSTYNFWISTRAFPFLCSPFCHPCMVMFVVILSAWISNASGLSALDVLPRRSNSRHWRKHQRLSCDSSHSHISHACQVVNKTFRKKMFKQQDATFVSCRLNIFRDIGRLGGGRSSTSVASDMVVAKLINVDQRLLWLSFFAITVTKLRLAHGYHHCSFEPRNENKFRARPWNISLAGMMLIPP